MGKAAA